MALCDVCGNYDQSYREDLDYSKDSHLEAQSYQPDLYYYWDAPIEEDYYWRDAFPNVDCMCEICFDIANEEKKIICLLYTSPSPRDDELSRMPSSA